MRLHFSTFNYWSWFWPDSRGLWVVFLSLYTLLMFSRLMIEVDQHEGQYLPTCKHWRAVLATPSVQEDAVQRSAVLQNVVLYLVLATHDNEQSDLTHRVLQEKLLDEIPSYKYVHICLSTKYECIIRLYIFKLLMT